MLVSSIRYRGECLCGANDGGSHVYDNIVRV